MPQKPQYYITIDGRAAYTEYSPADTAAVTRLLAAGASLEHIAQQTGIPVSNVRYVASMEHIRRRGSSTPETGETP